MHLGHPRSGASHYNSGMNPIDALFQSLRAAQKKAFMPFLTAGDPDLAFTKDALTTIASSGASLIEVGFPFSDPIADGPVIQASYTRALNQKLKLAELFETIRQTSQQPGWKTPLVAMASYSLIYKREPSEFIRQAKAAGFSGAVLPDLPVEEAEEFAKLASDQDFKSILLVTPTTSLARTEKIVKCCSGFVYVVSIVGITGERDRLPSSIREMIARLRTMTALPLCVGFGVSKPEHVNELKDIADGVIVGTALVRKLERATTSQERATALRELGLMVSELSAPLKR